MKANPARLISRAVPSSLAFTRPESLQLMYTACHLWPDFLSERIRYMDFITSSLFKLISLLSGDCWIHSWTFLKLLDWHLRNADLWEKCWQTRIKVRWTRQSALSQESQGEQCAVSQTLGQDCFSLPPLSQSWTDTPVQDSKEDLYSK